ncbi:SDR family oxidoreductase [Nocardioides zeae]|uniref:SDR family oxidoreductase n=1 Tax=Nocardioides zeae TaxID=1457234 RepID=A0A6P0HI05_9ACTN|nr:SDR family oxidoreductase [Nocardioides zeae]
MSAPVDPFGLDGRVVVVTGASSGLGTGFARSLGGAGARLVLAARRVERLEAVAAELRDAGVEVATVAADVARPDDCARVAQAAVDAFGRLDGLVNNAGLGGAVPALKETPQGWQDVVGVNLDGVFWTATECARRMADGGAIVNVASVHGHLAPRSFPHAAYAATKSGVLGLTRALAAEWSGRRGIRVNALCPGYFASEMTDAGGEQLASAVVGRTMLGRYGEQHELDGAVRFLLAPASSYVTGTSLTVDGGYSAW